MLKSLQLIAATAVLFASRSGPPLVGALMLCSRRSRRHKPRLRAPVEARGLASSLSVVPPRAGLSWGLALAGAGLSRLNGVRRAT